LIESLKGHPIFFDPVNHTYHNLLNERLVSNTEILEDIGFSDYSHVPEQYRIPALERGTAVHKATALLDQRRSWTRHGIYRYVRGYVEAWRKFKKDFKFKPDLIEKPLYDPVYKVATTPDRWGDSIHGLITVQIKTGKVEDWVGLQLSFEERCIQLYLEGSPIIQSSDKRFAVELRSDGTYKERRFDDPNDIRVFLSAVTVHQWQRKHGGRQR